MHGVDLVTVFSLAQYAPVKGEDRLVALQRAWPRVGQREQGSPGSAGTPISNWFQTSHSDEPRAASYNLFAVFDGHNGPHAARHAVHAIVPTLEGLLPPYLPEGVGLDEAAEWAALLQEALVRTILELHAGFARTGGRGGSTATLLLQVGRLVTCASVGTSKATLDTGPELMTLSGDHRVEEAGERRRLLKAGAHIARTDAHGRGPAFHSSQGVGPSRLWPGGLTLSRSIGDFSVSSGVLPLPRVIQVMLPPTGGRLVVASDGVWRAAGAGGGRIRGLLHSAPIKTCPYQVTQAISGDPDSATDASLIVADVVSPASTFQDVSLFLQSQVTAASASSVSGCRSKLLAGLSRLRKSASTPSLQESAPPADSSAVKPKLLTDVDVAALLGLLPDVKLDLIPIWYTPQVGSEFAATMAEAWEVWHLVHRRREAAHLQRKHQSADDLVGLAGEGLAASRLQVRCGARSKSGSTRSCLKHSPSMGGSDGGTGGGSSSDDNTAGGSKRVSFADDLGCDNTWQSGAQRPAQHSPPSTASTRLAGVTMPPSPPRRASDTPPARRPLPRLRLASRPSPNTCWKAAWAQSAGMYMSGAARGPRPSHSSD